MSYTRVQFIAYRIYTGPGRDPDHYVGLSDEAEDVRQRVKLMAEAVEAAGARSEIDPSSDVLKVFIAPEFYFRSTWGGYTDLTYFTGEGAGRDSRSIVGGLADAVEDERWKDWLFVFGTSVVVAAPFVAQDYYDPKTGKLSLEQFANLYGKTLFPKAVLNIALVQKGGYASEVERVTKAVAVIKENMSDIDWLHAHGVILGPNEVAHFPAVGPGTYALEVNTPGRRGGGGYNGGSIFMLDNITFGLEVCLDHSMERLHRAKPQSGDFFVQVQLIPSGGMIIVPTSVATLKGGLVCNVDGLTAQTTTSKNDEDGFHSELYSVLSPGQPRDFSQMREVHRATADQVPANADLTEVQKVFWLPPDNDVNNASVWAPGLVIYSAVDIPAPVAAKT